jgi:hypothetical protein
MSAVDSFVLKALRFQRWPTGPNEPALSAYEYSYGCHSLLPPASLTQHQNSVVKELWKLKVDEDGEWIRKNPGPKRWEYQNMCARFFQSSNYFKAIKYQYLLPKPIRTRTMPVRCSQPQIPCKLRMSLSKTRRPQVHVCVRVPSKQKSSVTRIMPPQTSKPSNV